MSFRPSWLQPGRYPRLLIAHTNGKTRNITLNDNINWERRDTELVVFHPHHVQHYPLVTIEHYTVVDAHDYPQRTPDEFTLEILKNTDHALDTAVTTEDYREHKIRGGTPNSKCILSKSCLYCQQLGTTPTQRWISDVISAGKTLRQGPKIRPGHDCSDPTCPFI